jgi:DNA-binding MarR family transcriptional regulator
MSDHDEARPRQTTELAHMLGRAGYVSTMSVKIQRYDLVSKGRVLATRPVGREVGAEAAAKLADSPGLLLSFYGVDVASPSFLREVLNALRGVLMSSEQHWLLFTGMNEDVQESVELVLKHEKMVLGSLEENHIDLLGGSEHLSETLREAQKLGKFTAPELAKRLKVKLPALHQRLNQLAEAGLLMREDDPTATRGKRGKYTAPPADELREADGESAEVSVLAGAH